jgi:hypothetical protein
MSEGSDIVFVSDDVIHDLSNRETVVSHIPDPAPGQDGNEPSLPDIAAWDGITPTVYDV